MKSKIEFNKLILIFVAIILIISSLVANNCYFYTESNEITSFYNHEYSYNEKCLKFAELQEKIHIDNNWSAAKEAGICSGEGTFSHPYVLKDLKIDGGDYGHDISIRNSNVYFMIENCTLSNAGSYPNYTGEFGGIHLSNVTNAKLIENNCSFNYIGIYLFQCDNCTIIRNIVNNNYAYGVHLFDCKRTKILRNTVNNNLYLGIYNVGGNFFGPNNISGNIVNNNELGIMLGGCIESILINNLVENNYDNGILLSSSHGNTILENNINNNNGSGIYLRDCMSNKIHKNNVNYNLKGIYLSHSSYNNVSLNILRGNEICWEADEDSLKNIFENNECSEEQIILGYELFLLIWTICLTSIFYFVKRKKPIN
ncbi:MAG: right-handed parallel beta-helix repeat-containing protein [Candidatus Lokiarchaeota archaeon]|nr:right-handed parallel beta-helix repeat-containing protein [Candidatus Lokiarchaeota archaeon]